MSQTSFLEEVVSWDDRQCQQNLEEALPRLITHLQGTESVQEEVGIMKIICQSFLPCIEVQQAELCVFSHITDKTCQMWDRVVEDIKSVVQQGSQLEQQVQDLFPLLFEVLDCFKCCVQYVQRADHPVDISQVHSLPYGAVHLMKGSYQHCKDSSDVYGEMLSSLAEPLSHLFKKAHSLQVAFIEMLQKITVETSPTEQDAQDLCFISQGLFAVCRIVTGLDVKLMCSVWKAVARFCVRMKEHVKNELDVDGMVSYLCREISQGFLYLFQLAPPLLDSQDMTLSQGDTVAFQQALKVLGYQMRILVSLLDAFSSVTSSCQSDIVSLLTLLHQNLPPSTTAPKISGQHLDDISRQLLIATDPLLSAVISHPRFMEGLTKAELDLKEESRLAHLLILVKTLDLLPRQESDVFDRWVKPSQYREDEDRDGILTAVFKALDCCHLELSLPVFLPGGMQAGKPLRHVSLYDHVCVHVCGFLGSFPAKYFKYLEESLLTAVLSDRSVWRTSLAVDTWCFLARYGTADLCYQHVCLLLDLTSQWPCCRGIPSLSHLIRRLVKFMEPNHQADLVVRFPPASSLQVWRQVPVSTLPSASAAAVIDSLLAQCVRHIQHFVNLTSRKYCDIEPVVLSLQCLANIYRTQGAANQHLSQASGRSVAEAVSQLWSSVEAGTWTSVGILTVCLASLLEVSGHLLSLLPSSVVLQIFEGLSIVEGEGSEMVKLSTAQFLQQCGKVHFSPSPQQPQILQYLAAVFERLLDDKNCLVHHYSLESLAKFAEQTPHETVIPDCIGRNTSLQDIFVACLNKVPHDGSGYEKEVFLKDQHREVISPPTSYHDNEVNDRVEPASKRKRVEDSDKVLEKMIQCLDSSIQELEMRCRDTVVPASTLCQIAGLGRRLQDLAREPG